MQNHHEADPKQQCDRDANDATKSFDTESYDFDTVWPGPYMLGRLDPRSGNRLLIFFFIEIFWRDLGVGTRARIFFEVCCQEGGGGGGFRLKPHIEVRFKWMWGDGGCLSKRKKRQNGVLVSLSACAHIMVTRAGSGCGANKKMAHDQLAIARFRPSSRCRARRSTGTR